MSQSEEPTSDDHNALIVPPVQGDPKTGDGLQGEVTDTISVNYVSSILSWTLFKSRFCVLTLLFSSRLMCL
jgi:hypothetical protein